MTHSDPLVTYTADDPPLSDTASTTYDGRTVVDAGRLIQEELDVLRQILSQLQNISAKLWAYTAEDQPALDTSFTQSFDARDWAAAFVAHVRHNPAIATDEGTMIGWFANAIMRGYDHARQKFPDSMQ